MSNRFLRDFLDIVDFLDCVDLSKYTKEHQKRLLEGSKRNVLLNEN